MRTLFATLLLALLVPAARAQEGADTTAQLPKGTPVAFRIRSFDRVDAIVKDWLPMLKAMGLEEKVKDLDKMSASDRLFMESGLNADMVDRTQPIYVGIVEQEWRQRPLFVLHPAARAAWEGKKELREGHFAVLRGGAVVVGEGGLLDTEARGTPTTFRVDGDAVVHVYLSEILAKHREDIEQGATEVAMGIAAMGEIPEQARALILPVVTSVKNGILSLESLDYGLTWTGERLETEGFLAIQEGSGLRNLLKRVGEPGSTDLVAYLPKEAFMTATVSMNPDWPAKEMKELLEKAGGGDVATALLQLVSMGAGFSENVTGKAATAVNMNMMAMGGSFTSLYELKAGVDAKKVFETFDPTKANDALKKIGIPITYSFERAVAKHGETELHRFGMASDNPILAMQFAALQGYWAAENGILFMAMSPTAEDDVKAAIDRVRRGEKVADHPHAAAMARLGRGHNIGMTINLAALKPMAMMFGMFGMPREVIQAFQNIPDVLPLSTAITFPDGNLRWRGDWPVKEVAKVAESLRKAMPEPPPEDEEFD
jgi:hypothetical protein